MGVYAVIDDGTVTNLAVCDDPDHAVEQGWVCVDDLDPRPCIGSTYDGHTFTDPPPPPSTPTTVQVQVDPQALSDVLEQAQAATTVATLKASVTALVQLLGGAA